MAYEIRSITQVGTSEPFELQVARGQIPGHKHVFKFGVNPTVQNVEETVWEGGGPVSSKHTKAHETLLDLGRRLLLEKKKKSA